MSSVAVTIGDEPKSPAITHRFDSLKIGTCITMSWFTALGAVYSSVQAFDTPGKLLLGGTSIVAGLGLTGLGLLFNRNAGAPVSDKEIVLNDLSEKVSSALGIKRTLTVHLLEKEEMGHRIAEQIRGHLLLNREKFYEMTPRQRYSVIVHDIAHGCNLDRLTTVLGNISKKVSMASIPVAAAGLVTSVVSRPLSVSFIEALSVAGYVGSTMLVNKAQHIKEYRADRIGVEFTGDPDSAVSAIEKLLVKTEPNTLQKLWRSHPTRDERVQAIRALNIVPNQKVADHTAHLEMA